MNPQNMIRAALNWVPEGWITSGSIVGYLVLQILVMTGKVDKETANTWENLLIGTTGIGLIRKKPV